MAEPQKHTKRKGVTSFKTGAEEGGSSNEMEQLVVTINPAMRKIFKIEKVDKDGKRQELTEQDYSSLVGEDEVGEIETALEEAFEAGVEVVLSEDYEDDEEFEDDEEKVLRRLLISELLIHHPAGRRILSRLHLTRLLRQRLPKRRWVR